MDAAEEIMMNWKIDLKELPSIQYREERKLREMKGE